METKAKKVSWPDVEDMVEDVMDNPELKLFPELKPPSLEEQYDNLQKAHEALEKEYNTLAGAAEGLGADIIILDEKVKELNKFKAAFYRAHTIDLQLQDKPENRVISCACKQIYVRIDNFGSDKERAALATMIHNRHFQLMLEAL